MPSNAVIELSDADVLGLGTELREHTTTRNLIRRGQTASEVVPDSEEERIAEPKEVIVISSDSEEEVETIVNFKAPFVTFPGGWHSGSDDEDLDETLRILKTPRSRRRFPMSRRIVESSGSEESEPDQPTKSARKQPGRKSLIEDVVELMSSSDEQVTSVPSDPMRTSHEKASQDKLLPYLTQEDGGSTLVFDEPRSARKPLPVVTPKQRSLPKQPHKITAIGTIGVPTPVTAKPIALGDSSSINSSSVRTPTNQGLSHSKSATRVSKKAIEKAEQTRRENYAKELFMELNTSVFKTGLPQGTKLNWNKRLLTTAGRAKYRRSRDGVESAEIELATKILDCDERIRNTLSHEMCHLATWVIDKKLDENHGKLFQRWASTVTKRRPDIEITTKHDYEISYPYKWECQKCQKIYGRYSKSIRPDECVCGACREGRLVPLFTVRNKTQRPKISQLAAGKSQDSPCSLPQPAETRGGLANDQDPPGAPDTDADIEALTMVMRGTQII